MNQKLWICGVALLVLTGCAGAKGATHEPGAPASGGAATPAPSGGTSNASPDDHYSHDKSTGTSHGSDGTKIDDSKQGSAGTPAPGNGQGGAQSGASDPGLQKLTVVMKDFDFEPKVITLKKGIPVEVTLVNQGSRRHDFSIVGDFSFESDPVSSGERLVVRFTPDKVGTFQLVCSQIGHKAAGMVAQVIITE